ncbi:MAG: class I tRNA ligase family protein, partial [Defluviitaleaceae bacterium]|nr:class I tRNA ligase family protein [Defluviitaleaceae bacterium]
AHELGLAAQRVVDFVWDEFCDWYVEIIKPRLYAKDSDAATKTSRENAQKTMCVVLNSAFRLLHPFVPFITEDLYLALADAAGIELESPTIMRSSWPKFGAEFDNPAAEKQLDRIKEAVRGIRAVRTEKQVPPSQKIAVVVVPENNESENLFKNLQASIGLLTGAKEVSVLEPGTPPPDGAVSVVAHQVVIYLPLDSLVDAEKERARLAKERKRLEQEIARIDAKLANEGFLAKAPPALVAAEREKRGEFAAMLAKIETE